MQDVIRRHISLLTNKVPVSRFVKHQAKRSIASEAKFRQENIREVFIEDEVTPPSPLTGHSTKYLKTSKDDGKEIKKDAFLTYTLRYCSKSGSSQHSGGYEVSKHDNVSNAVQVLKPVCVKFTVALNFKK